MKKHFYFTIAGITMLFAEGFSQQKTIERAIVKSKTEITFPENNNRGAGDAGDDQGGGRPTGMESKNTIYYKGDLVKTYSQSDFGNNTVIVDKKNKKTTTLIEAMGRKTGFYSTEEDEQAMRDNMQKRMDSVRQARGNTDSARNNRQQGDVEIINTEETKKIAGYNCRKAMLKTTSRQGEVNETTVWYCPDLATPAGYPVMGNTAGGGGFARSMRGGRGGFGGIQGLEKINGFIMGYEMSRPNGFKMQTEVTSIEVNPDIDDKVFDIPKGYDLKPMSEMQNQMGRMFGRGNNGGNGNN
jgi:GLPGLI family protein